MHANSPGAVSLSVGLHAALIGSLFWITAALNHVPPATPLDFVLEDLSDIELAEKTEVPGPPDGPPKLRIQKPKIKPAPKPLPPPPAEQPAVRDAGKPSKTPVKDTSKPQPKGTTYKEFSSKNANQLQQNSQSANNTRPSKFKSVNAAQYEKELREAGEKSSGTNGARLTLARKDEYFIRLGNALKAAFILPSGLSELLKAQVEFTIGADGTFSDIRIVRSSGEPDFDAAVIDAFRKVRTIGPFPGGKADRRSLNFSMAQED